MPRLATTSARKRTIGGAPPNASRSSQSAKPPYRVPAMGEVAALPWNGYSVVSTFSGCGGSSLGYKLAGYRVLYASEFIPAAQETYRANFPATLLDTRDVRQVQPEDILRATGLARGALDLLDGSPPCASFSMSGKREQGWGTVKAYSDTQQRTDDLFFEYARLLKGLQPKVFVAENVAGLVRGTAKGYFLEILQALRDCGYEVHAKLLDAQWLGVPQARQRLIFVGVRRDLVEAYDVHPVHPRPLPYRYTFGEALRSWPVTPDNPLGSPPPPEPETNIARYAIGALWEEIRPGESHPRRFNLTKPHPDAPCPTITQTMGNDSGRVKYAANVCHPFQKRYLSLGELRRVCAFPDDFILTGTFAQRWERLGRAVPPVMMSHIAGTIAREVLDRCQAPNPVR